MNLSLSDNNISDVGAVALAQALHHNSTLDLSNNNISDSGAVALAHALHHNSTLKKLDLSNNNISDGGTRMQCSNGGSSTRIVSSVMY